MLATLLAMPWIMGASIVMYSRMLQGLPSPLLASPPSADPGGTSPPSAVAAGRGWDGWACRGGGGAGGAPGICCAPSNCCRSTDAKSWGAPAPPPTPAPPPPAPINPAPPPPAPIMPPNSCARRGDAAAPLSSTMSMRMAPGGSAWLAPSAPPPMAPGIWAIKSCCMASWCA